MMMLQEFSAMGLRPQELFSYILDFNDKLLYLKQQQSCKFYEIIRKRHTKEGSVDFEVAQLPNIAEIFDLFPYVMYYNKTTSEFGSEMLEFKYSYPLGTQVQQEDAELLAYFKRDSLDLDRVIVKANSLNITEPFTLTVT